jgi:hypothetical protein
MTYRRQIGTLLLVGGLLGQGAVGASITPAERCAASQLTAVGKLTSASLACHATTATTQVPADPCLARATAAFEKAWLAAEATRGCTTTATVADVETEVGNVVDSTVGELTGTPEDVLLTTPAARACAASKLNAAGKDGLAQLVCAATATRHTAPIGPTCQEHAASGLLSAFAAAEVLGGCADADDVFNEVANFEALVAYGVTNLDPPCGTFVRQIVLAQGSLSGTPAGVAVDGTGNTYVADSTNNLVWKFNAKGHFVKAWGGNGSGAGQLNIVSNGFLCSIGLAEGVDALCPGPIAGMAVDAAGAVYVPDNGNFRILKFDRDGNFVLTWGSQGGATGRFNDPLGVTVTADGHLDVLDALNLRVDEFDSSGTFVRTVLNPSDLLGVLGANGIAADGLGDLFVEDGLPEPFFTLPVAFEFDSTATPLGAISVGVAGIAVAPTGDVFTTDGSSVTRAAGPPLSTLSMFGSSGTGNGQFSASVGIATDTAGTVYVGDQTTPPGRVEVFTCPQSALCGALEQPCCNSPTTPACNGTLVCEPGEDRCRSSSCTIGRTVLNCTDNNPCAVGICDPILGCESIPVTNGTACSDGNVCNGAETCQAGSCTCAG